MKESSVKSVFVMYMFIIFMRQDDNSLYYIASYTQEDYFNNFIKDGC